MVWDLVGGARVWWSSPLIFALGLVFVFLVLAAQYENYVDSLIIMLTVPLAIFGALAAQSLRGLPNDIVYQVGLVMLIGLSSKNAILTIPLHTDRTGTTIECEKLLAAGERGR